MRKLVSALLLAVACGGGESSPSPSISTPTPDAGQPPPPDAGLPPDAGSPPPPASHVLTVSKNGSGTVRSSLSGIDCGGTCAATYTDGTAVSLSAAPDNGWTFSGWGGGCSGSDGCTVVVRADTTVWATFAPPPPPSSNFVGVWTGTSEVDVCGSGPCSHSSVYEERRFEATGDNRLRTFEPWPGCINNPGGDTIWSVQSLSQAVLAQQTTCPPYQDSQGCVHQWTIDNGAFLLTSNSTATYQLAGREVLGAGCAYAPGSYYNVRKVVNPMNKQP